MRHGRLTEVQTAWDEVKRRLGIESPNVDLALIEFQERRKEDAGEPNHAARPDLALYDLSIEQLCGQINLAFEAALEHPDRMPHFLMLLASREGAIDLDRLLGIETASQATVPSSPGMREQKQEQMEAQSRSALTRLGQFRIDAFQIAAGGQWRQRLRTAVVVVSIGFSVAFCYSSAQQHERAEQERQSENRASEEVAQSSAFSPHPTSPYPGESGGTKRTRGDVAKERTGFVGYSLVVGLIGAYLAMLLRDLTAIVENKRRQA